MGYGREIFDSAIARLSERRSIARRTAQLHREEVARRCPRALEIEQEIAKAGLQTARIVVSGGVDVMTGTVRLGIHEERKDDPETIAMLEEMRQTFGDVFTVEYTGLVYTLVDTEVAVDAVTYTDPRVFFAVAAAVVLLAALTTVLVLKKRQMAVLQTSTGETVEADARLTKSEVEYAVKNDAEAPSDALKQRVLDKFEKA